MDRFSVAWPAPGYPALVSGGRSFSILACHPGGGAAGLAEWARGLVLRRVADGRPLALMPRKVSAAEPAELGPLREGLAGLPHLCGCGLAWVDLEAAEPLGPRGPQGVRLYDLFSGDCVIRSRCVAAWNEPRRRLHLAFASDIHWSGLWDQVAAAAVRHAPDLLPGLIHPRRMLERLIGEANRLAAAGELDLMVLGGDLVEHVHPSGGESGRLAETNVARLVEALHSLEVPTVAVAGNHDWRLYPWRPRLYGLRAVGVPGRRQKSFLKAAGLWDAWPVRLRDFNALRTRIGGGSPGLTAHRSLVAPALSFALTLHGTCLVFASTGRDLLPRSHRIECRRWGLLCRGLRHVWLEPDSEGFTEKQAAGIGKSLRNARGAAVFFHAPLLRIPANGAADREIGHFPPGDPGCLKSQVDFERRLSRRDLRRGVAFRNPGAVLQAMAAAGCPVAAFSGHVHQASAIFIDRRSWLFRATSLSAEAVQPDDLTLVTAPALAQLRAEHPDPPGYLLAEFADGRLLRVERRDLPLGV